jgi:hypothetical protein
LHVQGTEGVAIFEIGESAPKWREKILHPKSRMEKLGVKPSTRVSLLGNFDEELLHELSALTGNVNTAAIAGDAQCVFFAAPSRKELATLPKHAKKLKGSAALWVIYPKGLKEITETDVIGAGRKAGLKDVKVVGFSPMRTALKFVIPLSQR